MHFVYILKSEKRSRFYIGCTENLEKRIAQHNSGFTKSTKPYRPWVLIYFEKFDSKLEAMKREWYLKHPPGYLEKRSIIEQYGSAGGFA